MHNREHAFAAGSECQPGLRIERGRIDAVADRKRGDELPAVRIDDGHQFVAATGKQPPMFAIDGQSAGSSQGASGQRDFTSSLLGSSAMQLALVFDIHEDFAFLVADRKLGLPIHFDGAQHRRPWRHRSQ